MAASPDSPLPFSKRPVSCLSWVWAEDRMAAASTCSASVTCLSAVAVCRHTSTVELSRRSGGWGSDRCEVSHTHVYILGGIFAVFSADKVDSLDCCFRAVFTLQSMHAFRLFQICTYILDSNSLWKFVFLNIKQKITTLIKDVPPDCCTLTYLV